MAQKTDADATAEDVTTADTPDIDARMDRIEETQREQGGMLEKILDRLPGKAPASAGDAAPSPGSPASAGTAEDIQSTVRREIAEANQRAADEARAKGDADWRASVDDTLEKVRAEKAPREPQTGFRGRLQRAMFGGDQ